MAPRTADAVTSAALSNTCQSISRDMPVLPVPMGPQATSASRCGAYHPRMVGGVIDRRILLAFAGVVLLAGSNIVAVRFSNRELDPFWGAGIRFFGASSILWALVAAGGHPLPRGRDLRGALFYGVLSFAVAYAFFYLGSQEVSAGLGGTIMASVPLLTVMFAAAHRLERLRLRGVVGAGIALAGIAIMSSDALSGDVSLLSVL